MKNIGSSMWDELLGLPLSSPGAELSGYVHGLPKAHDFENGCINLYCSRLPAARRFLRLWKGLKDERISAKIAREEGALRLDRQKAKAVFRFSAEVFHEIAAGEFCGSEKKRAGGFGKSYEWDWLRGLWGAAGSVYRPQSGYHMVVRVKSNDKLDRMLLKVLGGAGIVVGTRVYRGSTEYMIRNQESMVTCLVGMGLVRTSLMLVETAMYRSAKSKSNSIVNCDAANIRKSLSAAREQLALIGRIENEGLWDKIPPQIKELAKLRVENPSASLRELGQMLSKPVSKSTVEYRWRRLESLVSEYQYG